MASLRDKLASLTPSERALLARRIVSAAATTRDEIDTGFRPDSGVPLSSAQERLWFLHQLDPSSSAYNIPLLFQRDHLPTVAATFAINRILSRHEALRTCFPSSAGVPVQRVAAVTEVCLVEQEVEDLPLNTLIERLRIALESETVKPFSLENGPLFRARLFRGGNRSVLILVLHHAICDKASIDIIVRELNQCLKAFAEGLPVCLQPLPIQYCDYALWQKRWLRSPEAGTQIAYWSQKLADSPGLDLPSVCQRPAVQTYDGDREQVFFNHTECERLRAIGRKFHSTPFVVMLTVFKCLLARYSGQETIIVGTPVEGRNRPEMVGIVGLFVNMLVLRTTIEIQRSFESLVESVGQVTNEALIHQDVPFERIVEELNVTRDPSRNPLFQVMFQLESRDGQVPKPVSVNSDVTPRLHSCKVDLTLEMHLFADGMRGRLEYNVDLFDRAFAATFLSHFQALARNCLAAPEMSVGCHTLQWESEEHPVLRDVDIRIADIASKNTVLDLFGASVTQHADEICLVFGERMLTYREVDLDSTRIARKLATRGVRPDHLVAFGVGRSPNLLVLLLAVLKTGAAYLPLDPDWPVQRLQSIFEDATPACLVTESVLKSRFATVTLPIYALDELVEEDQEALIEEEAEGLPCVHTSALAYVIYTSGSTGKPKGVKVRHDSLLNCLLAISERIGFDHADRFLAITTVTFDIAALEFLLPIISGGTVVLADRIHLLDGQVLAKYLGQMNVTHMQATPASWQILRLSNWQGCSGITALCGGEALPWALAEWLLPRVACLWNVYGPTETTIWSAAHRVSLSDGGAFLANPVANTEIHVLGESMETQPLSVVGEIYIGGAGLSPGYIGLPELTRERFPRHPTIRDQKLFRTGDFGRRLRGGRIEFLGRKDFQVKVRGFRIELEEIEAVACRVPGVVACVVVKTSSDLGEGALIAYVIVGPECGITDVALRTQFQQALPSHMCPSRIAFVSAFPTTHSGKIDRMALSKMRPALTKRVGTEWACLIEEYIAYEWKETLRINTLARDDNFFDVGGNSLSLVQIASRLSARFEVHVPIMELFRSVTVESQARYLQFMQSTQQSTVNELVEKLASS